jgi:phosphoheptose isomerase
MLAKKPQTMDKSVFHPMNTSLSHLTPVQRRELETAGRIIIEAVRPEKIILFGIFSVAADARLFAERLSPGIGAFDLLVVTGTGILITSCRTSLRTVAGIT